MKWIYFLPVLLFVIACSDEEDGPQRGVTKQGFPYAIYERGDDDSLSNYHGVSYHLEIMDGGREYFSTKQANEPIIEPIEDIDNVQDFQFAQQVFPMMTENDSVVVWVPTAALPQAGATFSSDTLELRITITEAHDETAYNNLREEQQQRLQEEQAEENEIIQERVGTIESHIKDFRERWPEDELEALTNEGLTMKTLEQGVGETISAGEVALVDYYGVLMDDGKVFDHSIARGQPLEVPVGQGRVITGWEEGLTHMRKNGKYLLFIPSELAYGEQGSGPTIPPNSDLLFYMEIVGVLSSNNQ